MSANLKAVAEPTRLSQDASAFLEARGLDPDLCERRGLTSGIGRDGHEWICVPYMRGDDRVNRKFRRIDTKAFTQDKGTEQILWNLDCLRDAGLASEPLIITEGEFDALSAIQAGYQRSVSVPLGADGSADADAFTSGKYAPIRNEEEALRPIKRIVIAADKDGPGTLMLSHLTAILGPARCQFVTYPEGCKDLNDVLRLHGVSGVRSVIDGARWVRVAGVHKLYDMAPLPPLETWWPDVYRDIDTLIPICPAQVSVWTGIPGHGKSSLLNAIAWSISDRDGVKIAHGSFEATPQRDYVNAAIAYHCNKPYDRTTDEERRRVSDWVHDRVTFLVADGYCGPGQEEFFDADLDWFFSAATTAVARDGARIVILDPWSQIEHARLGNEAETTYVQRALRRGKMFARSFDVHVAIVAHPTKMRRLEDGSYAMPEGYEISGSAHWFNGVDLGITSHRDPPMIEEDGELVPDPKSTRVLVRAWKKKNHSVMGKPGDAYASFDSYTGRYSAALPPRDSTPQPNPRYRKDLDD